jgi:predicted SAM-dependent methyltransferase
VAKAKKAAEEGDLQIQAYEELGRLANAAYLLAGEVLAFDEATITTIADGSMPAFDRISTLARDADRLIAAFAKRREAYVAAQLKQLRIGKRVRGLQLNVGSGPFAMKNWLNVDLPPAQLGINLRWGLPLPDGCARVAFMSHVLEHFYYPGEALALLKELRRVLEPGGRLRIVVPDIEKWLVAYATNDAKFFASRKKVWKKASRGTRLEQLLLYTGSGHGAHPSYFFGHKGGYDYETLRRLLRRARFVDIERSDYQASRHKALRVDNHSAVADASFQGGHYSLFVEASAPRR